MSFLLDFAKALVKVSHGGNHLLHKLWNHLLHKLWYSGIHATMDLIVPAPKETVCPPEGTRSVEADVLSGCLRARSLGPCFSWHFYDLPESAKNSDADKIPREMQRH